jgi:hypothetical protein
MALTLALALALTVLLIMTSAGLGRTFLSAPGLDQTELQTRASELLTWGFLSMTKLRVPLTSVLMACILFLPVLLYCINLYCVELDSTSSN